MRRVAGATLKQTDARSISTIRADANGHARTFSASEMRRRVGDAIIICWRKGIYMRRRRTGEADVDLTYRTFY
jgi:hypothetical protein